MKKFVMMTVCAVSLMSSVVLAGQDTKDFKIENIGNQKLENKLNQEIEGKNINETNEEQKKSISTIFEEKYHDDKKLSFVITTTETQASTGIQKLYYNINLETGEDLTLKDLLGDNYKELVNKSVQSQIEQRMKDDENQIFFGFTQDEKDMGIKGFESIKDDQTFYINKDGNVVITFEQFEIAPGYMGVPEFEIMKK